MLPQHDNPLTMAYIASTKAASQAGIRQAMRLIRRLETDAPVTLVARCKLAGEVLIERKQA